MADDGAINARFDAMLADYETQLLGHLVSSADQLFSARRWMAERWPLADTVYNDALEPFLPIQGNRLHYGGNQAWYPRKHQQRTACGSVALANITAYAAHQGGISQLFDQDTSGFLSQVQFLQHMEKTATKLPSSVIGIPFTRYFIWGGNRYMRSRGLAVKHWHRLRGRYSTPTKRLRAEAFLQYHIRRNRPVACIHWGGAGRIPVLNPSEAPENGVANMNLHWVVVTGIGRQKGIAQVTVSSCGYRYVFPLNAFLQGAPSFVTPEIA